MRRGPPPGGGRGASSLASESALSPITASFESMGRAKPGRANERGLTAVEAAAAFAVLGIALAAIGPACVRSVRLSRTVEATDSLKQLSDATVAKLTSGATIGSAPLTPAIVPRGEQQTDPSGTWNHATWRALQFGLEEPHWYSYRVDVDATNGAVRLVAHGDLDGDGVTSTFLREVDRTPAGPVAREGVVTSSELE